MLAFGAHLEQSLHVGPVVGAVQQHEVDRQEDGRHVLTLDRAEVHARDPDAVPGHTDVARQSFVARREQRLERATGRHRRLPLVGLDEVVQLDQVDVIDIHPLQRPFEFGSRCRAGALAGLRREEHLAAMVGQPATEAVLGRAVRRRRCRCG